jgi:L-threonylcarbamoyladenylate synthase
MIVNDIPYVADLLRRGELVGIPTETVYGLAANALDDKAIVRIFEAKSRPFFDPLIVHLASVNQLETYALEIPEKAWKLAKAFWPGPLTLVLKRQPIIPDMVTSGLDTVGLRVPNHPSTLELLSRLEFPLAAPSANPFGYISPTTAQHVADQLEQKIAAVLDGGPCIVGVESTIVHCASDGTVTLLRQGGLALEDIQDVVGEVSVRVHSESNPSAPGMLASHYAPRTPLLIGDIEQALKGSIGRNVGYISFQTSFDSHPGMQLSASGDLSEAARKLFAAMRAMDNQGYDYIVTEHVPNLGIGRAINDRLNRAAAPTL